VEQKDWSGKRVARFQIAVSYPLQKKIELIPKN